MGVLLDARYGLHLLELRQAAKDEITEPFEDNTRFKYNNFKRQVNRTIWDMLSDKQYPFLETTKTDSTVASQAEYDFPSNYRFGSLLQVRYKENDIYTPLQYEHFTDITDLESDGTPSCFYVKDNKIGLWPRPSASGTDDLQYIYQREHPELTTGDVQSATSTTLVLEESEVSEDDYYNDMYVAITAGSGQGQVRKVDDYTGSSQTCTVSAWDTTPDATSTYSFYPLIPKQFHYTIVSGIAANLIRTNRDGSNEHVLFQEQYEIEKQKLRKQAHGAATAIHQLGGFNARGKRAPYDTFNYWLKRF